MNLPNDLYHPPQKDPDRTYIPPYPETICPAGGFQPNCFLKVKDVCPDGYDGNPPNCVEIAKPLVCPDGYEGVYPKCFPPPICSFGYQGTYPNCFLPKPIEGQPCPVGYKGIFPHCLPTSDQRLQCPGGLLGTYPNCFLPPDAPEPISNVTKRSPHDGQLTVPRLIDIPTDGPDFFIYINTLFQDFMIVFQRIYINDPNEVAYRLTIFIINFMEIQELSRPKRATTYDVGPFTDLTDDEFESVSNYRVEDLGDDEFIDDDPIEIDEFENVILPDAPHEDAEIPADCECAPGQIPDQYDQRVYNYVTPVKNQNECGACWAFVTSAVIEGMCAIRTNQLQDFSTQSLIDCDTKGFVNRGCRDGKS